MSHLFISSHTFKAFLCAALTVIAVASPLQGQTKKLYLPLLDASDTSDLGLAFVNPTLNEAQVTLVARTYNGAIITGSGITNPVTLTLPASSQKALRTVEIFGSKINGLTGWVELSASMPAVRGFFVVLDRDLTFIGGTELITTAASRLIFPKVSSVAVSPTQLTLVNTSSEPIHTLITLYRDSGQSVVSKIIDLPAFSGFTRSVTDLVPSVVGFEGYAIVDSAVGSDSEGPETLIGIETYRKTSDIALIRALPEAAQLRTGYLAHLASQGGYSTTLTLINIEAQDQVVRITAEALQVSGRPRIPSSITVERTLPPYARLQESVDRIFNLSGSSLIDGYIRFETPSDTSGVFAFLDYGTTDGVILSAVEAQGDPYSDLLFSQVAEGSGYYTGLALVNPNNRQSVVTLDIFNRSGSRTGSMVVNLRPRERKTRMLGELFQPSMNQLAGYIHITATRPIFAYQFFGSRNVSTFLANVSPQGVRLAPQATGRIVTASQGANVISSDGSPSVLIPPNALSADTPIGVAPLSVVDLPQPGPNERLVGAVDATPSGTTFRIPVRLNFPLNVQLPPGTPIPLLIFNQSNRQYAPTEFFAVVDASGRAVSAEVSRLATFAVSSPKNQLLTVSGLSALQGVPGTTVTIAGNGFSPSLSDNIVTFSGAGNASVRATVPTATPTSLQASVPDDAVTGPVVVQVGSLSSVGVLFTVPSNNPVPSDVSISPSTVWDRSPTDVRISGIGFLQNSVVNYDGEAIGAEFIDSTLLVITLRKKDLTRGVHRIEVVNPPPGGGTSDALDFNVCIGRSRRACGTPPPAQNEAPTVNAGPNQTITLPASANLNGTASDDGLPTGSTVTTTWSKVSGPGTVTFASVNARATTARFSAAGSYVLRLTASDTALSSTDDITITVNAASPTNLPPTVNAGPNQTITLPASANLDATASDDGLPAGSTLTRTWSKISGPGTVSFGNVNAQKTTANFSSAGTYVLRLTASDGALSSSDDVTITVNAAPPVSGSEFYVDPDYAGSPKNGSAARPWSSLGGTEWAAINNALTSRDVIVYFSARKASSDTDQVYGAPSEIDINNKTTNSFRLTLDGHSKYNTNDSAPSWQNYSGNAKARVRNFLSQNGSHTKRNKVTIDGFRISRTSGGTAVSICGDDWVVRNSDIFHTPGVNDGPLVLIVPTANGANQGTDWSCPLSSNITIENNVIHDSQGELVYVGGAGCSAEDSTGMSRCDGFPSHTNILIQNNNIYNGGVYGAQGDGIDVKAGISNLRIRNNTIYNLNDPSNAGIRAIVISGARTSDPDQNIIVESNLIYNVRAEDAAIALVDGWGTPKGVEVRNNVIANLQRGDGIKVYRGTNHKLYNNTIYKATGPGITVVTGSVSVINNLLVGNNGSGAQTSFSGTVTSTNNGYSNTFGGSCTNCVSGLSGAAFADAAGNNLHLVSGSAAIERGTSLDTFSTDKDNVARPQGKTWDIGAYQSAP